MDAHRRERTAGLVAAGDVSPLLRHELLELFPLSNVTAIPDLLDPAGSRTHAYQDIQSFLSSKYRRSLSPLNRSSMPS